MALRFLVIAVPNSQTAAPPWECSWRDQIAFAFPKLIVIAKNDCQYGVHRPVPLPQPSRAAVLRCCGGEQNRFFIKRGRLLTCLCVIA
jgi:hypothetical protein